MECNSPGRPPLMSGWRPWAPNSSVLCAVFFLLAVGQCVVCNDSGCDWDGSGLRSSDASSARSSSQRWLKSRSVVPVYLRCDQGRVTWKYPRGALRVLLRLGGTGNGGAKDFRACVKIDANSTGAAVHLEGHRKLIPIHKGQSAPRVADNDDGEVRRCFTSYKGQVALFLEATPETNHLLSRDTFRLWYHLTPVMSQRDLDDELADDRIEELRKQTTVWQEVLVCYSYVRAYFGFDNNPGAVDLILIQVEHGLIEQGGRRKSL
ncbi:hypothetical protein HPB52_012007 [Rhipicephalus sanguineus]|uniref:Secreted protein n=1 Tax=Rhipicephalus sanguineus TaxID=34632 RepID=A0A9D4PJA6_RHISA|nr:hypothetical protein HPB52_012007 [Rhipicephalus sanguineus]